MNVHAKYEIYNKDMFEVVSLDCAPPSFIFLLNAGGPRRGI